MNDARATVQQALGQPGRAAFTCSFQAEDMVVLDFVRRERPDIPVLFLETGYHFREVYDYRDQMAAKWKLNLVNLMPKMTLADQEGQFGLLYQFAPDRCCGIRKVEPLFSALENVEVWFTGLRREQSPTRANLQPIGEQKLASGHVLTKVSPLYDWTMKEVGAYLTIHEIPHLPLYDQGYTSIGCQPCTALPDGDNSRSGRWGGKKLECGIHIEPAGSPQ
jgi:phosphoadenosine phosphosulfate reductase